MRAFETAFAEEQGCAHGVMTNSAASANLIALKALALSGASDRVYPRSEIITPVTAPASTVWPLLHAGLKPVFAGVNPLTLTLDPSAAEQALSPVCRGIMVTAPFGNPCDLSEMSALCEAFSLALIGDCGSARDARFGDRPLGAFGRVATFDLELPGIGGGIAVTGDKALADAMRLLRGPSPAEIENDQAEEFHAPAYDVRPPAIAPAMALAGQKGRKTHLRRRLRAADRMRGILGAFDAYVAFQDTPTHAEPAAASFAIIVRENAPFTAQALAARLADAGIEAQSSRAGSLARRLAEAGHSCRIATPLEEAEALIASILFVADAHMSERTAGQIAAVLESMRPARKNMP